MVSAVTGGIPGGGVEVSGVSIMAGVWDAVAAGFSGVAINVAEVSDAGGTGDSGVGTGGTPSNDVTTGF